jgi:hypothetical protein
VTKPKSPDSVPGYKHLPGTHPSLIRLGTAARERINAGILINRLQRFAVCDPDNPKPGDVRMTRTQAMVALSLLRKVLPDLASIEVSGNPDQPLMVQVVRFSDGDGEPISIKPLINLQQLGNGELLEDDEP